jgi:nucleotide-binding universal stress UspA family protein
MYFHVLSIRFADPAGKQRLRGRVPSRFTCRVVSGHAFCCIVAQETIARKGIFDADEILNYITENGIDLLIIGSTANTIANQLQHFPVWIVGGDSGASKILIAVDGSESTRPKLDYAAVMLKKDVSEIVLLHVIRGVRQREQTTGAPEAIMDNRLQQVKREMTQRLESYAQRLTSRGFDQGSDKHQNHRRRGYTGRCGAQ